jgi:hypothetical protein
MMGGAEMDQATYAVLSLAVIAVLLIRFVIVR